MKQFSQAYLAARAALQVGRLAPPFGSQRPALLRLLASENGPDVAESKCLQNFRHLLPGLVQNGAGAARAQAKVLIAGAGDQKGLHERAATLKMLRHLHHEKSAGGQQIWVYARRRLTPSGSSTKSPARAPWVWKTCWPRVVPRSIPPTNVESWPKRCRLRVRSLRRLASSLEQQAMRRAMSCAATSAMAKARKTSCWQRWLRWQPATCASPMLAMMGTSSFRTSPAIALAAAGRTGRSSIPRRR